MKKAKYLVTFIIMIFSLVVTACGSKSKSIPTVDPNTIMTQVALTVQADVTRIALLTPSATPLPLPTATLPTVPTLTLATGQPIQTPQPVASADNAAWVADVTVPDGTVFWKNQSFTKTWKIMNTGTTTWDPSYKLVYIDGPILGESLVVSISEPVKPNEQIQLSVPMKSPAELGTVVNYWRMMNGQGQLFGDAFYVQIVVGTTSERTATPNG